LQQVGAATKSAWATGNPADALANAVPYMQAFGHMVIAWTWLDVMLATPEGANDPANVGRRAATQYFFHFELPKIDAWLKVVASRDPTCAQVPEEAF
jgi:butyryl-CoA dehydrogenase